MNEVISVYDLSNFIINTLEKRNKGIKNYQLNSIISLIYYDSSLVYGFSIVDEEPVKKIHYSIPSVYKRFRHYNDEIKSIPSDFNFLLLLDDDFDITKELKPHSESLIEGINKVGNLYGEYIEKILSMYGECKINILVDITDKLKERF